MARIPSAARTATRPAVRPAALAVETLEGRMLFAVGKPSVVGYLPDYRYSTGLLNSLTTTQFQGLTQIDFFSVLPNNSGLLPGTTVGSLTNTSSSTASGYTLLGANASIRKVTTAAHAAGLKVDVVIGGGGDANTVGLTSVVQGGSALWQNFASSVTQFVNTYGLDGIDIDWEPSSLASTDVANYGNLIAAVRVANPTLNITSAVNASKLPAPTYSSTAYILNATALSNLSEVNVMAYDLNAGNTSPIAQAESLFSAWGTYAAGLGTSRKKLIFGMPFYGTSGTTWANTQSKTYSEIVAGYGSVPPVTSDSVTFGGATWNYNGPATIGNKATYALANGFGGVTTWEIGQDYLPGGNYDSTSSLLPQFKKSVATGTGLITGTVKSGAGVGIANTTVYVDSNTNGLLDTGETSTTTSQTGAYTLAGLLIGSVSVRQVLPNGYTQTTPGSGLAVAVTVAAGASVAANFVDQPPVTATSLTLARGSAATIDATQSLTFTATLAGGVPDGQSVVLKDAGLANSVVATAPLVGGVATFPVPAGTILAGGHSLYAAYAGDANFAASSSAPLAQTVQVVVSGVTINGNNAALAGAQRSRVNGVVYAFSEPVNAATTGAFAVVVHSGATGTVPTLAWTALNPAADGSSAQWAVTFSGDGVVGGSVADGVYDLTMSAGAVTSDFAPAVAAQPRAAETFFRLFGDIDGDRSVNITDFNAFAPAFGTTPTSGDTARAFDLDNNGAIDIADFNAFAPRFGTSLPAYAPAKPLKVRIKAAPVKR